jgi:hypothetical protein
MAKGPKIPKHQTSVYGGLPTASTASTNVTVEMPSLYWSSINGQELPDETPPEAFEMAAGDITANKIKEKAAEQKKDGGHSSINPRTQKAKGVMRLTRRGRSNAPFACLVQSNPKTFLLPYQEPKADDFAWGKKLFARPCPERPRHGFVDSRPVSSLEEVRALYFEALEADPVAELLVMPFATSRYSAVATHAGVTWSLGNDGATGTGKPTRFIPASSGATVFNQHVASRLLGAYGPKEVGINTSAYLEIVEDQDWSRLVQTRDGPEQTTATDWVPKDGYEVCNVLVLSGEPDLLSWEKDIQAFAKEAGPVLYAPGLGLSSHYAVHAIANGIPVITSKMPNVGDKLAIVGPEELTSKDYKTMALASAYWSRASMDLKGWKQRGLPFSPTVIFQVAGSRDAFSDIEMHDNDAFADFTLARCLVFTAVGGLHAVGSWGNQPHLLDMRAFCAWALVRMLVAACVGELRHWFASGPGRMDHDKLPATDFGLLDFDIHSFKNQSPQRIHVHGKVLAAKGETLLKVARGCTVDFAKGWGGGYGGAAWHQSALLAYKLASALLAFEAKPSAKTWAHVLSAQNIAVNAAHNGGYLLDKWVSKTDLDAISFCPSFGFCNALIGGYLAQQCLIEHEAKQASKAAAQ